MALLILTLMSISSTALAASEKPVADFYSPEINNQENIRQIGSNTVISFFDNSTGSPTSWLWDFGDGNLSTEKNPTHVYGAMGGYTVNLTVKNAVGSNTTSKYGYALIDLGDETASPAYFSSSATSGDAPFKVTFHAESGGYLSSWTFGDGSYQDYMDDNSESPEGVEHIYLEPGQYTVTLYQGNLGGKSAITKYHYITVTGLTRPVASFTADKASVLKSLTIEFTDKSIGKPTSWSWNFGDGNFSTEQNPMHTYSTAGNYTVNLTASNENGTDSKLVTINVLKTTGPFAYITNANDRNISVIDTATDNVVDTMDIGSSSVGVAVSTDGKKVYVTDGGNKVFVIDTTTSKVTATVNGLNSPHGIAITPDGAKAYVANWGSGSVSDNGTVSVIDTATKTITNTVTVGSIPHGVAVSPNGKKVYVTNYDGTISVIDTATDNVVDTIDIGQYPWGIVVNPEGTKVYVANYGSINYSPSHNVSVIDTATNTITDRVKVGNGSYGVAVNPEGTKVYVTNYLENTTSVIDTTTSTVIATVPVGGGPYGVSVTPDGKKVYVANQGSNYDPSGNTVSVIDATTNTVTATVKVGDGPTAFGQFIAPVVEQTLPVANFNSNVTEGYAPLTVQFSDLSQKASSRTWDFNSDGQPDSSDISPVYVYANAGTYIVNLTVSNENGTSSKTAVINVFTQNSSSGGSSGGSSHSSSSSGGAGVSPEPAKNVQGKELSQAFISNGKSVNFAFPQNTTPVMKISFDSKKTAGKTTAIVETLKNQSTLVSKPPADELYKYINIWVGSGGAVSPDKIKNAVVNFKVEKFWIQDKNIDKSSIALNRYSDAKWNALPTKLSGEDDKYLYLTAQTPGFSPFAITGKVVLSENANEIQPKTATKNIEQNNISNVTNVEKTQNTNNSGKGSIKTPGFEMICGIVSLFAVVLYKVSKKR